ncbi:putative TetR-family transcriptional regulator [Actinoplanes missouriensis 431]|uniref:Putative TetR-family transcriptional regulator n=1 Tax=Actinoplanes missouriensis (strain ATCC 14538 / DSM 43046 / CBS 188.64 / JCM 3121 / NBRC 102363 / NCIMB 12654 / NRRL B-3342 / UNCC 431) TaxID=512565 RepID=I0HAS3_ACTM4|nr:TetR/AcrR family transcriptional regulator [Actinoplanes missouriensis]BAL90110.1 putative TetR-family transcriptional regulator [Actinoplanes missouriensis 431]
MPRVSEAHLAARRQQILDAAVRCFVRKGFHQTSMQDVIKEADLSVGAFYRYFKSKNELITAIAGDKISQVTSVLDELLAAEPPPAVPEIIERVLELIDRSVEEDGPVRIAVQVWGEAVHDPEVGALVADVYGRVRSRAVQIAERAQAGGQLHPDADPVGVGVALFGLIQGYILQRILLGNVDRKQYVNGVRALVTG